jgi:hypothetical protein
MAKYGIAQVVAALREHHGLLVLTADALGCSRTTLQTYAKQYPEIAEVIHAERERLIDLAERGLYEHLQERSPWAIALVLKTLGRQRGYVDPAARGAGIQTQDPDAQEWSQVQYILLRALEHFPEARAAVTAALKASEPHEPQNGHYPRP